MEAITPEKQKANLWLASAIAGLAFHACLQFSDILDVLIWQMITGSVIAAASIFYIDIKVFQSSPLDAAKDLAVSTTGFTLSLATSILIYRAFFHRLRRFPGPFAARLTKLWGVYECAKSMRYFLVLEDLHKKYGDVVRTGPRELSVTRVSALPQITACRKTVFYQQSHWKQSELGMLETRDLEDHRRRRKPWEKGLGLTEIARYDAAMQDTIGVFLDQIACERGQRINVTEWIAMLAYDIMGVVSFGQDFGSLRAAKEVHAIKQLRDMMRSLGLLFSVPWVINFLSNMPGLGRAMGPFGAYCERLVNEKRKALVEKKKVQETPADVMSWLIQAFEEGGPTGAPTLTALHADGRALVIAGSDTTYGALTSALFHLASNPAIYAKLQAEVDSVCPGGEASFSHEKVKNLPLLDGVINETLRLKPPVPNGTPRITPPEGLQIDDDLYIPGNVHVVMPPWVMHRDERYFEKPLEFIPERWILGGEKAGMIKDRNAFFPFQIGMFHCAGKQLAYWEMRSVLARLALRYNIRFATAQDGKDYESKLFNTVTLSPPPLGMCFRPRKEAKA